MLLKNIEIVFHRMENTVGKGENAGFQHFLLFPQGFQKRVFPQCSRKWSMCGKALIQTYNKNENSNHDKSIEL